MCSLPNSSGSNSYSLVNAMRGGDEVIPGDDGGTADQLAVPLQRREPGELARRDCPSADHARAACHPACWKQPDDVNLTEN